MYWRDISNGARTLNIDWSNTSQMLAVDLLKELLQYLPPEYLREFYPEHLFLKCNFGSPLVVLTHDWDFHLEKEKIISELVEKVKYITGVRYLSMINTYLEVEKRYGYKSTILIRQSSPLHFKLIYMLKRLLPSGYEIGIHPEPNQTDFISILKLRKRLETALNSEVRAARVHLLKWGGRSYIENLSKAGIVVDSTFGYNNAIGYRGGIGTAFRAYKSNVLEIPQVIMDVVLFRDLGMESKNLVELLNRFLTSVREQNVVFAINWHIDYAFNEDYIRLYSFVLRKLKQIDAIVATLNDAKTLIERNCEIL